MALLLELGQEVIAGIDLAFGFDSMLLIQGPSRIAKTKFDASCFAAMKLVAFRGCSPTIVVSAWSDFL